MKIKTVKRLIAQSKGSESGILQWNLETKAAFKLQRVSSLFGTTLLLS